MKESFMTKVAYLHCDRKAKNLIIRTINRNRCKSLRSHPMCLILTSISDMLGALILYITAAYTNLLLSPINAIQHKQILSYCAISGLKCHTVPLPNTAKEH